MQFSYVETFGADQTGFFANGKNHIDGTAGKAVFLDDPHDLADDGNATFVVTAEHSAAVGA